MKLANLSDDALLTRLTKLVASERRCLVRMVAYLIEVEERRLHLDAACSSLYDFCVRKLGLSESNAFRRIAVARVAKRFPSVLGRIERGEIHVSALLLLRGHLTEENHEALLDDARGLSKRTLEQLLARRAPKPDVPDGVWKMPTDVLASDAASAGDDHPISIVEPLSADRYRVQLTASAELHAKIVRATDLMRHQNPRGELAVIFERALDLLIADLEKTRLGKSSRPRAPKTKQEPASSNITRATRREVTARDDEQCTFVSKDGERCPARGFLELDHVHPRALGGTGEASNVRLLCRAHNRLLAEKIFGRNDVERKTRLRRGTRSQVPPKVGTSDATPTDTNDQALERQAELRETFEVASHALIKSGFSEADVERALATVAERAEHEPTLLKLDELLRAALSILAAARLRS
jgi:5-methylcytosine-specific restriction endonuclease McrA